MQVTARSMCSSTTNTHTHTRRLHCRASTATIVKRRSHNTLYHAAYFKNTVISNPCFPCFICFILTVVYHFQVLYLVSCNSIFFLPPYSPILPLCPYHDDMIYILSHWLFTFSLHFQTNLIPRVNL
jgi:hypothetical protein